MTPDYERAALKATEILIRFGISSAPVSPLPILKRIPGVVVTTYQSMSDKTNQDRACLLSMFNGRSQDAFTAVNMKDGKPQYIVTYNQLLSTVIIQRALARELGHIVLGHDGSLPEEIRNLEAVAFANHLLCPRPLIHLILASGTRLTVETFGSVTGCYDHCLSCIRKLPAVHVPAEMNRTVRDNFMPYFLNFFDYQRSAAPKDVTALADFGTFMDGYEE